MPMYQIDSNIIRENLHFYLTLGCESIISERERERERELED